MRKILCICNHGNNRSPGLAASFKDLDGPCHGTEDAYLKEYAKHEAIALGAHHNSFETIKYFIDWADVVIDLSDEPNKKKEIEGYAKSKYYDGFPIVGHDNYGNMNSPQLREVVKPIVEMFR